MSRKLTAKQLLREVRSIKKLASSGFFKPEPIEYETESDLNVSIDSVLLDIVDGFGFLGATNVVVKGDTAYVKVEGKIELDVKKREPSWWDNPETNWDEVTEDIAKGLGGDWGEPMWHEGVYRVQNNVTFDQFSLDNGGAIVYNDGSMGGDIVTKSELSEDYRKDIAYIVKAIKKFFK
mgnify:CR=1 FL=1